MVTHGIINKNEIRRIEDKVVFLRETRHLVCCMCGTWLGRNCTEGSAIHTDHVHEIDGTYYVLPSIYPEHTECIEVFNLCPPLK